MMCNWNNTIYRGVSHDISTAYCGRVKQKIVFQRAVTLGLCSGTIRRYQPPPCTPRPQKAEAASQVWPGPGPVFRAYRYQRAARDRGTRFGDWEADLVCASKGKAAAARLYRTQEPLSAAGQGPRQDSRVLQCGAHSLPACCATKAEADLDAGYWFGNGRLQGAGVGHWPVYVFLLTAFSVAAWHKRKQQGAFAAVFSQGQQLSQDHGKDGFRRRRTTEQPAAQMVTRPDSR